MTERDRTLDGPSDAGARHHAWTSGGGEERVLDVIECARGDLDALEAEGCTLDELERAA